MTFCWPSLTCIISSQIKEPTLLTWMLINASKWRACETLHHQFRYIYYHSLQIHNVEMLKTCWNSLLVCCLIAVFIGSNLKNIQKSAFLPYCKPCLSLNVFCLLFSSLLPIPEISFLSELLNNPCSLIHLRNYVLIMQLGSTTPSTGPYYIIYANDWITDWVTRQKYWSVIME